MSEMTTGALAYYAIDKDPDAGDLAVYAKVASGQTTSVASTWEQICAIMQGQPLGLHNHDPRPPVQDPKPPHDHGPVPTPLSIKLDPGDCTYLISLADHTRAAFGPGHHPIMILPVTVGRALLNEVGLVYVDPSSKDVVFMPADEIPAHYQQVPVGAALTFRCNSHVMQAYWNEVVGGAGHQIAMRIPFFFNLYDTKNGKPVWTYGAHSLGAHVHGDRAHDIDLLTHGGIHPSSASQTFYV